MNLLLFNTSRAKSMIIESIFLLFYNFLLKEKLIILINLINYVIYLRILSCGKRTM